MQFACNNFSNRHYFEFESDQNDTESDVGSSKDPDYILNFSDVKSTDNSFDKVENSCESDSESLIFPKLVIL